MPTERTAVGALWANGWDGYIAAGKQYKAHAPAGSAWTDTGGGMFNAIVGQSQNQYYDTSGKLIYNANDAVKNAWNLSTQVSAAGLTAKLSQFTQPWIRPLPPDRSRRSPARPG